MTREEQRASRELKKAAERQLRSTGRIHGWRSISGSLYRRQGEMLYVALMWPETSERGAALHVRLMCKPLALDEMFWEIHRMAADAAAQPFSFHVQGAFTAPGLTLYQGEIALSDSEPLEEQAEDAFLLTEHVIQEKGILDLTSFHQALRSAPTNEHVTLDIVLCLLCEGAYGKAAEEIGAALERGESGGYRRGNTSILEDARDWCADLTTAFAKKRKRG